MAINEKTQLFETMPVRKAIAVMAVPKNTMSGIAAAVYELPLLILHAGYGRRKGNIASCRCERAGVLHTLYVYS